MIVKSMQSFLAFEPSASLRTLNARDSTRLSPSPTALPTSFVTITAAAKDLVAQSEVPSLVSSNSERGTDQGPPEGSVAAMFTGRALGNPRDLPLIPPTTGNLEDLQTDITSKLRGLIEAHAIPELPGRVTLNSMDELKAPQGYAHMEAVKADLASSPVLEEGMSAADALASHLSETVKLASLEEAYTPPNRQLEAKAIADKFNCSFPGAWTHSHIA